MSQRKTIEHYQLTRMQQQPFNDHTYSFIEPFLLVPADWSFHSVHLYDADGHKTLHNYLTCLEAQAYIIATAFLHDPNDRENRYTEMRLSHMIVDSWLAAGGRADGLRFLGVNWIVNENALASIAKEFQNTDANKSVCMMNVANEQAHVVTLKPCRTSNNPFLMCAQRVADLLSLDVPDRSIAINTVSLIRLESVVVHMVIEFESKESVKAPTDNESVVASTEETKKDLPKRTLSMGDIKRALSKIFRK